MDDDAHTPVTFEHCDHIEGSFYHGTKVGMGPDDLLSPRYGSNFEDGRVSNNIYCTAALDAAVWGAELAKGEGAGRIYIVEPTGPFEDDPNLTDKRFPGNPTLSYRTGEPLRIAGEVKDWEGHPPEVLPGHTGSPGRDRESGTSNHRRLSSRRPTDIPVVSRPCFVCEAVQATQVRPAYAVRSKRLLGAKLPV